MKVYFICIIFWFSLALQYVLAYYFLMSIAKDAKNVESIIYGGLIILFGAVFVVFGTRFYYESVTLCIGVKVNLVTIICNKLLHINPNQHTTGNILNLISSDVAKVQQLFDYHIFSFSPFLIFSVLFLLWYGMEMGNMYFMFLLSLIIFIIIPSAYFGIKFGILRQKISIITDQRLQLINDMLSGWLVTKMFVYEGIFDKMITNIRKNEINHYKISKTTYALMVTVIYSLSPITGLIICFIFYNYSSQIYPYQIYPLLGFCPYFLLGLITCFLYLSRTIMEFKQVRKELCHS